jgi:hypothetical protein
MRSTLTASGLGVKRFPGKGAAAALYSAMRTLLALALLFAVDLHAGALWTFEGRRYYDPLVAGVREPHVSAMALGYATRMSFMVSDKSPRRVWDIDLGAELPVAGWESGGTGERVGEDEFGIGLWIPIDFHMIEDFVDDSGPIVNTDYRFGGMIKMQYGLTPHSWLGARVHIGHESTHLGDEFSIVGQRVFRRSFERINVSWEYVDVGVMYERDRWSVRGGVTATYPFQTSYYEVGPGTITESAQGPVTPSSNWWDPYVGFDAEFRRQFLPDRDGRGFQLYTSAELRWRSIYDYHKTSPDASEDRQASVNLIAGIRKAGTAKGLGRVSPFVRYYRGVNPHGQFRNQKDYTEVGIGLRLVR